MPFKEKCRKLFIEAKEEINNNRIHYATCAALLVIGIGIRLYYLFDTIADGDELFSYVAYSSKPLSYSLSSYTANNHPLNTLLTHLTTRLLGNSLPVIRLWSFICGVLVMFLIYLVIRKLYNKEAAVLALAITASYYHMVIYSVTSRGYSLQACILLLLTLVAIRIKNTGKGWLWFILLTTLGFFSLVTFLLFITGVVLWLLVSALYGDTFDNKKPFIMKLVFYTAVSAFCTALVYLPYIYKSGLNGVLGLQYTKAMPVKGFIGFIPANLKNIYYFSSYDLNYIYPIFIAGAVIAIIFNKKMSKERVGFFLMLITGVSLVYFLQRNFVPYRVFAPIVPMFLGSSAAGLYFAGHSFMQWIRRKKPYEIKAYVYNIFVIGLSVLLIISVFPGLCLYGNKFGLWEIAGMDYTEVARIIKNNLQEGDLVVADGLGTINLTYYFMRNDISLKHLSNNMRGVKPLSAKEVDRLLIVTTLGYGTLPEAVRHGNLEFNPEIPYDSLFSDPKYCDNTLFEIMIIKPGGNE